MNNPFQNFWKDRQYWDWSIVVEFLCISTIKKWNASRYLPFPRDGWCCQREIHDVEEGMDNYFCCILHGSWRNVIYSRRFWSFQRHEHFKNFAFCNWLETKPLILGIYLMSDAVNILMGTGWQSSSEFCSHTCKEFVDAICDFLFIFCHDWIYIERTRPLLAWFVVS